MVVETWTGRLSELWHNSFIVVLIVGLTMDFLIRSE